MKRYIFVLLAVLYINQCLAGLLAASGSDGLDSLRSEINHLQKQLQQQQDKLNKCAAKNQGFQISGIAAVGLAGAGLATNISLYETMKGQQKQASNMVNKIEHIDNIAKISSQEWEQINQNLDFDKFAAELDGKLTSEEANRVHYLINESSVDELTEDDKQLLKKIFTAAKNAQRE